MTIITIIENKINHFTMYLIMKFDVRVFKVLIMKFDQKVIDVIKILLYILFFH